MYHDRAEAGRLLASMLEPYRAQTPVIVALPRGGVVVGAEVAESLGAPLDILLVRKIGAPTQPELAIGAVVDLGALEGPTVLLDPIAQRVGATREYLHDAIQQEIAEIRRRESVYRGDRPPIDLAGRAVILVDDGIATGSTTRAALRAIRQAGPFRLILAVPVAPPQTLARLRQDADEVVCPLSPEEFRAVGEFYEDFTQTSDAEVIELLERAQGREPKGTP
jgi:putative phosphoribosyl transferase